MKKVIRNILIFCWAVVMLGSCSKKADDFSQVPPVSADTSAYIMWNVSGVQQTNRQLYAMVTVVNNSGVPVVTNKKLMLDDMQGTYKTDKLLLPKGLFKLSKFIVVQSSDTALYAVPIANSAKASQVTKPLPGDFSISKSGINNAAISVLKINETDRAESFGYTNADFGLHAWTNLNVLLKINVGQVVYDSLPGVLHVDAVSNDGGHWTREIPLQKGITNIRVPVQYVSYGFKVVKWNAIAETVLSQQALRPGMLLNLQAARQPKRLIAEASFLQNQAGFQPDSRSDYIYGANGLTEIRNYQKSTIVSGLPLANVYRFLYTGNRLDNIKRFDATNTLNGYTLFEYQGSRISSMYNTSYDQYIGAAVEYYQAGENEVTRINYLFQNGNTMLYTMFMKDGNKVSDDSRSSTGGGESGVYEYDSNINPKYHLGYPDLYFTNSSKNNLTLQQKNYAGAIPTAVPYKFEYVYDNDGYPAEVYTSYKGFTSQQHLYTIKKIYTYQ